MTGEKTPGEAWRALLGDARLRPLVAACAGTPLHLVGGAVRDAGLGLAVRDLDVVVAGDGPAIAARLAAATGARLVALGGERFAALRLVSGDQHIDLWDLRGGALLDDLWRRDFTVNAIAVAVPGGEVVDPTGGLRDLERRSLRATRETVFAEDPVRVLRLARLATTLPGFEADAPTVDWARETAPRLAAAPHERVRVELEMLLSQPRLAPAASFWDALDLQPLFFGEGAGVAASAVPCRLAAERLDRWRESGENGLSESSSAAELSSSVSGPSEARLALHWTLFAELFTADRAGSMALLRDLSRRGLMTRATCDRALRLLAAAWQVPREPTGRRQWLHSAGVDWRAALALRAALARAPEEVEAWRSFERGWLALPSSEVERILRPPVLLTGAEVQELLGIGPGPAVGAALARLRNAQVAGAVVDREAAEALLRGAR
jgi:poly(A) polymerase